MQVNVKELEPCRVALTVEVAAEQVTQTTAKARKELAKWISVPGFRRGKAPESLAARYIKPQMVQEHALELLLPEVYQAALTEANISPFGEPRLEVQDKVEEGQPFSFTAIIPTAPKVKLGQYQGLDVQQTKVPVRDEDVDGYLDRIRGERQALREVDRPIEEHDFVTVELTDLPAEGPTGEARSLRLVAGGAEGTLDGALLGKSSGDEFEMPANEEQEAPARKVLVKEVRAFVIPEMDDEFAASISQFQTLAELKEHVRQQLEQQAQDLAEDDLRANLLAAIRRTSEVNFPQELLDAEVASRMSRFMKSLEESRTTLDMYLRRREKTLQEFEAEVAASAREMINNQLILEEIAEREGLATEAEQKGAAEESETAAPEETEEGTPPQGKSWVEKTWDFLKESNRIATVEAESPTEAA